MMIQYGDIFLNLLCVRKYEKQAVFDGPNYAYSRVTVVVDAVFNPATQSDSWGISPRYDATNHTPTVPFPVANLDDVTLVVGDPDFTPPGGPGGNSGVPAVISEDALRHYLMQPRLLLQMSVGGIVTLRSPIGGMLTDVMGGPTPLFINVAEIHGTRTWLVQYGISTCINDCPYYTDDPPYIISHTYEMSHTLDVDYFTTEVTRGRAVLRADLMVNQGDVPDNIRKYIVPPIPLGFKRERVHVQQDQQPNIIQFETIDRELPIGWQQAGVTRVKAFHTYGFHKGNVEQAATRMAHTIMTQGVKEIGNILSRFRGDTTGGLESGIGVLAGAAVNLGFSMVGAGINSFIETAPVTQHVFDVEVWGDGTSTRRILENFARAIIQSRLETLVTALANIQKDGVDVLSIATKNLPFDLQATIKAAMAGLNAIKNAMKITGAFVPGAISQYIPKVPEIPSKLMSLLTPGVDTTITHEITGKYVRIHHVVQVGPIASMLTGLSDTQTGVGVLTSDLIFPEKDNTGGLLVQGASPMGPSYDGVSRGTYANVLVPTPYRYTCEPPPLWYQSQQSQELQSQQQILVQEQQNILESQQGLTPGTDNPVEGIPIPPSRDVLPGPDGNLQPIDYPPLLTPDLPEQGITTNPKVIPPPPEQGIGTVQ